MKIEINNGTYVRDEEAAEWLTSAEDEYVAALAQKLVIRRERQQFKEKKAQEQEKERQRLKEEREREKELQRRIAINRLYNGEN